MKRPVAPSRRALLRSALSLGLAPLAAGCALAPASSGAVGDATPAGPSASHARHWRRARVVVVGGGYGGATAAKYLRLWSGGTLDVTLVEAEPAFISCPGSNLVVAGRRELASLAQGYDALTARHGVRLVHERATAIDLERRTLRLASGAALPWDRLLLAPGVELLQKEIEGLAEAHAAGRAPAAWTAGAETLLLRDQLRAMPDGGVVALTIPEVPYRCPPGPYERACLVAEWLARAKPRAKLIVLDANPDISSKAALFRRAFADRYKGRLEYRPQHRLVGVDARPGARATLRFEVDDDLQADVLNALPPMRAGALAANAGLADANGRWCRVDFRSFESAVAPGVHVLGDAVQSAQLMPKSGHMANAHAKVAAAAVLALLAEQPPPAEPLLTNTCYSLVSAQEAVHVASVHRFDAAAHTFLPVEGAGGLSAAASAEEARLAEAWAANIRADMLD